MSFRDSYEMPTHTSMSARTLHEH